MAIDKEFKLKTAGLLCLLAALSLPSKTDAVYTMAQTCAYLQKGYIGDPNNCQNWGYCSGGSLIGTGTCNTGLLYDSASGMCNYAKQVQCQSSSQDICNNLSTAKYIMDPNDCNAYSYCANKVLQSFNCPQFQVFNASTVRCQWATSGGCSANSICRLVQNNQLVGDPNICGNYIRCENGTGVSTSCGNGSKFNPMSGACKSTYHCSDSPDEVGGATNNPGVPMTNSNICAQNYAKSGSATQYFSDKKTCYGYYRCTSATSDGAWDSCPFATHFNPTLQECVTPYTYACPYNRCGNLNSQFVAQAGCLGYTVCSNQVAVVNGTCAASYSNYPYFNEVEEACVSVIPNETICTA